MAEKEYLNAQEAADYLGVSRVTLWKLGKKKLRNYGKKYYPKYSMNDLQQVYEERTNIFYAPGNADAFADKLTRDRIKKKTQQERANKELDEKKWRKDILECLQEIAKALKDRY